MNKLKSITKGLVSCSLVLFVIFSFFNLIITPLIVRLSQRIKLEMLLGNYNLRPGYIGTLCFVVINDSKYSHNYTFDLSKFSSLDRDVSIYRTSTSENLNKLDNMPIDGSSLNVVISPQSITTFVIENAMTNLEPAFDRNSVYKIVNKSDNTKVLDIRNSSPSICLIYHA